MNALGAVVLAGTIGLAAWTEMIYINGSYAAVILAAGSIVTFTVAILLKSRIRESVMAGHTLSSKGDDEDGEPVRSNAHHEPHRRPSRLTDEEKEEIVQRLFDKIYAEIGRNFVKKALLILVAFAFAATAWLAKNHIDIK